MKKSEPAKNEAHGVTKRGKTVLDTPKQRSHQGVIYRPRATNIDKGDGRLPALGTDTRQILTSLLNDRLPVTTVRSKR